MFQLKLKRMQFSHSRDEDGWPSDFDGEWIDLI